MMLDALLQLSAAQAVTATAVSTNVIDLLQPRDLGMGTDLYGVFNVDTTATASGAATVTLQLITSASSDMSSPNVIAQTDALAKTELTAGRKPISLCLSSSVLNALPIGQRYMAARYVVATGPLTAGAFSATLTNTEVAGPVVAYPAAYTVY